MGTTTELDQPDVAPVLTDAGLAASAGGEGASSPLPAAPDRSGAIGCAMCRGRIETVQKIYPTVKPPPPSSSGSGGGGGGSFKTASVQLVEASSTMGLTVTRQVRRLDFCLLYYIPCPILFMSFGTHLFSIIPLHVPCNIPLTHYISCFFNIVDF